MLDIRRKRIASLRPFLNFARHDALPRLDAVGIKGPQVAVAGVRRNGSVLVAPGHALRVGIALPFLF